MSELREGYIALDKAFKDALENHQLIELRPLEAKVTEFKCELENSQVYNYYLKSKELESVRRNQRLIDSIDGSTKLICEADLKREILRVKRDYDQAIDSLEKQSLEKLNELNAEHQAELERVQEEHLDEISKLEEEIKQLKDSLIQSESNKQDLLTHTEDVKDEEAMDKSKFEQIYYKIKEEHINADSRFVLVLKLDNNKDRLLIKNLKKIKLP